MSTGEAKRLQAALSNRTDYIIWQTKRIAELEAALADVRYEAQWCIDKLIRVRITNRINKALPLAAAGKEK